MISIKKVSMLMVLALTLLATGCGDMSKKKKASQSEPSLGGPNEEMSLELNGDSDSGKAGSLQTVTFAFNSARLSSDARSMLGGNASFLKENSTVQVQIEGHCDERGGIQFNLALGEKRAQSVRDYLVANGIDRGRLSTISFGKDRPITFGHDEEAWGQNRRANFVVTSK